MSAENRGLAIAGAVCGLFPNLPRRLRPKVFPYSFDRFFRGMIGEALSLRRARRQERNDFINHLLELQREYSLTEEDMASHAMTFMFDGLDTTSNSIAHCLLLVSCSSDPSLLIIRITIIPGSLAGIRSASSACSRSCSRRIPAASCPIWMRLSTCPTWPPASMVSLS